MKAQTPAEGILKRNDFGDSKYYQVVCGCGQEYHDHNVEVEADECGVNVNIYATLKTDYWTETVDKRYDIDNIWLQEFDWAWKSIINGIVRKVKLTWELWSTGAITTETTIHMTEQQALNYSETLKSSIKDVKEFRNKKDPSTKAASKIANEGDCI